MGLVKSLGIQICDSHSESVGSKFDSRTPGVRFCVVQSGKGGQVDYRTDNRLSTGLGT